MACLYHFWGLRPSFICSVNPHLDSSLVFSTALKVLQAKGSRHLRPSFGTHYSPVSEVGLVWLIVHCRGGKIYCIRFNWKDTDYLADKLPWPPGGRQGCLLSLISATFPPILLQKAMYLPWEAFNFTFMMEVVSERKKGSLTFRYLAIPGLYSSQSKVFFRIFGVNCQPCIRHLSVVIQVDICG